MFLALALAASLAQATDEPVVVVAEATTRQARPKPSYTITASPRMRVLDFVEGSTVTVTFSVRNIDERLYCAEVVWMIGEDVLETHESDCDPYESAEPEDLDIQIRIKQFVFRSSGTRIIKALLRKNKKTLLRAEVEVFIK